MIEKFEPKFFDSKSKEMKPVPPEQVAEMEEEEKELKKEEKSRTIRLKQEATFADLFGAEEKIIEKFQESEDEDVDDLTHLAEELWDNFDESIASEVLDMRIKLETLRLKQPEEYTEEEKKSANLKVMEYFQEKGYSAEDVETFLPIKFKKDKKKK